MSRYHKAAYLPPWPRRTWLVWSQNQARQRTAMRTSPEHLKTTARDRGEQRRHAIISHQQLGAKHRVGRTVRRPTKHRLLPGTSRAFSRGESVQEACEGRCFGKTGHRNVQRTGDRLARGLAFNVSGVNTIQ